MQPSTVNTQRLYGDLAWLWPIISPPGDYVQESTSLARILLAENSRIRHLLNLGCGGGSNDFTLKRFFNVTGVDTSCEMLDIARNLNPEAAYLEGDMRTLRLEQTFDAVACLDAVAYMLTRDELLTVFATAAAHLKPGGLFITFVEETPTTFRQNHTVYSTHASQGYEVAVLENTYDPDERDSSFELTFVFLVRNNGNLDVYLDRHVCGMFPMPTWVNCLEKAGLQLLGTHCTPGLVSPGGRQLPILLARKQEDLSRHRRSAICAQVDVVKKLSGTSFSSSRNRL